MVGKLALDPLAGTKPQVRFYPLDSDALSQQVISVLSALVPAAKPTWDADGRRLMVVATPKDQQAVEQAIAEVTKNAGPAEKPVLRVYALNAVQRHGWRPCRRTC